jgi:ABC-type molybdate transport system substrate-binding protein
VPRASRRSNRVATLSVLAAAWLASAAALNAQTSLPWSRGANNPAEEKGYVFQVEGVDNVPDLHGNPADAQLVLFISGNQFMVLPKLLAGFEHQHPELRGRIFYETLPPGILRKQIDHNGVLTLGNLTLQAHPDVYQAGLRVLSTMLEERQVEQSVPYATNDLEIMIAAGNPRHIRSLSDLGRGDVRLSMPNPQWEGVANQIANSLRKAGGEVLFQKVMLDKVKEGTTYLTQVHHRQTAMRILGGLSDAGVTWSSEVRFQESIGNPVAGIKIPPDQNTRAIYAAGALKGAPHQSTARAWVAYLTSREAQSIYREYGFGPPRSPAGGKP